jgi:hypothetical protein
MQWRICMHSISLRIHDKVIDKVMYFLENLPENEVEILEDSYVVPQEGIAKKLNAVSLQTSGFKFDREEANAR